MFVPMQRADPVRPSDLSLYPACLVRYAIAGLASLKVYVHLLCESRDYLHEP